MKSRFGRRRHNPRVLVALLLVVVSMVAVAAAAGSGGPGHGWGWGHSHHGNWSWYPGPWNPPFPNWDNDISNVNITVDADNWLDIDIPGAYPSPPCGGCGGGSWAFPGLLIDSFQAIDVDIDVDVAQ